MLLRFQHAGSCKVWKLLRISVLQRKQLP